MPAFPTRGRARNVAEAELEPAKVWAGVWRALRLDAQRIPDSDTVLGVLHLGFGTVLSRSLMLNVGGEFRVSGAVPNFRLSASLPIRF